jgi:copper chaperone CopZ
MQVRRMSLLRAKDGKGLRMTNVEISYNYGMSPDEAVMRGIDNIREVYGIRRLKFNEQLRSVAVEYDATRLNPATVASLLRRSGLDLK